MDSRQFCQLKGEPYVIMCWLSISCKIQIPSTTIHRDARRLNNQWWWNGIGSWQSIIIMTTIWLPGIPCDIFLVNGHDAVPDSALTASSFHNSELNNGSAPYSARLHAPHMLGSSHGSWSPATRNVDVEYIQVTSSTLAELCYRVIIILIFITTHIPDSVDYKTLDINNA